MNSIAIVIPGELPDLNSYIKAINSHRFVGNKMKQEATNLVAWTSKKHKDHGIEAPFFVEFHWVCKDKRKDKDNVAFAKKFILDGLQVSGVISQDSWKGVDGFSDRFSVDKSNPRVEIIIRTAGQD